MHTLLFQESIEIPICLSILMLVLKHDTFIFLSLLFVLGVFVFLYRLPLIKNQKYPHHVITSPCDGKILEIVSGPDITQVKIYLSIIDVHVQWFPTHGLIRNIIYKPGEFNLAHLLEKSDFNECMTTIIQNERGIVRVDQIAGQVARRIVNWSTPNTYASRGDLMGMIKLSSRVDVYLPTKKIDMMVSDGDRVSGKTSPLAKWKVNV